MPTDPLREVAKSSNSIAVRMSEEHGRQAPGRGPSQLLKNVGAGVNEKRRAPIGISLIGKFLILLGALLALTGIVLTVGVNIPFLGKLPGDILIQRGNATLYRTLMTSVLLSCSLFPERDQSTIA